MKAQLKHIGQYTFESKIRQHTFQTDVPPPLGKDHGPTPKEYLLSSILGCSGMDVVGLLKKNRIDYGTFEMEIEAQQSTGHPKVFTQIEIIYKFQGDALLEKEQMERIKEAIDLSMGLYCGISAMIARVCPIHYKVFINDQPVHENQAKFDQTDMEQK